MPIHILNAQIYRNDLYIIQEELSEYNLSSREALQELVQLDALIVDLGAAIVEVINRHGHSIESEEGNRVVEAAISFIEKRTGREYTTNNDGMVIPLIPSYSSMYGDVYAASQPDPAAIVEKKEDQSFEEFNDGRDVPPPSPLGFEDPVGSLPDIADFIDRNQFEREVVVPIASTWYSTITSIFCCFCIYAAQQDFMNQVMLGSYGVGGSDGSGDH